MYNQILSCCKQSLFALQSHVGIHYVHECTHLLLFVVVVVVLFFGWSAFFSRFVAKKVSLHVKLNHSNTESSSNTKKKNTKGLFVCASPKYMGYKS